MVVTNKYWNIYYFGKNKYCNIVFCCENKYCNIVFCRKNKYCNIVSVYISNAHSIDNQPHQANAILYKKRFVILSVFPIPQIFPDGNIVLIPR